MTKTVATLINIELEEDISKDALDEYLCTEFGWLSDSGIHLKEFSEVPNDTTIEEIKDAIVHNRSERIEEEYSEAFEELA